jgi:DNA (cytosine-5)-methyltransferase 1
VKIGALFAGYGGLELGVQSVLGGELAWYSEIDKGAQKILEHHHPDVPNHGDITDVDWTQVEPVDVLTGGFPCQDVSHAGRRAGLRPGTRSGLWSHMAYAIDQLRPRLVVAENVRGLLSAEAHSDMEPCPWCMGDDGPSALRALGAVLGDLADLGYDARWHGLRAADIGAPHGRFRVFVVAYPRSEHGHEWRISGSREEAQGGGIQ